MSSRDDDIRIRIAGDLADINKSLRDLRTNTRAAGRDARSSSRDWNVLGRGLSSIQRQVVGIAGAYLSFRGVQSIVRTAIRNTVEQERVLAQVEARLRSTGRESEITTGQLSELAAEFQRLTTFGDEAVLAAQAGLLAFQNLPTSSIRDATQAALDLASATGRDLTNAANQVGRALNFPVEGLQALQSAGIRFSVSQRDLIRNLVETGRVAEAQRIILDQIELQYGGAAAAARDTFGGALASLKNAFGDLLEGSGGNVNNARDAIEGLITLLQDPATIAAFQNLVGAILGVVSALGRVTSSIVTGTQRAAERVARLFGAGTPIDQAADRIAEIQRQIDSLEQSGGRRGPSPGAQRLIEQLRAEQEALRPLVELNEELAASRARIGAQPGAPAETVAVDIDARPAIRRLQAELQAARTLLNAELRRLNQDLDNQFADNLVSFSRYYAQRTELETRQVNQEIEQRRAALRLLDEEIRLGAISGADVVRQENERLDLVAQITVLEQRRAEVAGTAAREQAQAERDLAQQLDTVRIRLQELQGDTIGARQAQLQNEFRDLLARLRIEGDTEGEALIDRLINVELARTRLQQLETEYQQTLAGLARAEQRVQIQVQTGVISESEGRRQIINLQRQTAAEVERLIPLMRELAEVTGDPAAIERLEELQLQVEQLGQVADRVGTQMRQAFQDAGERGIASVLDDINNLRSAALDFINTLRQRLNQLIAERLFEQLFSGVGNSFGGFLSGLFGNVQHTGGMAGTGWNRKVPALAFAGAPRMHSGGFPGLKAGEVPIIAERGEEVLSRRDPRNRMNGGGSAPSVTVNVAASDVRSFSRASQSQIAAEMGVAMQRALARNT